MSSVISGVLFSFVLLVCRPMPAGAQSHGDLRLASSGRVEFFDTKYNLGWASICIADWDEKDAEVVCRQREEDTSFFEAFSVDDTTGPTLPYLIDCEGKETLLKDCHTTTGDCGSSRAAVTCVSGLSTPVIVGIAVGCLVFLLIGAGSIAGCIKFKNNDDNDNDDS